MAEHAVVRRWLKNGNLPLNQVCMHGFTIKDCRKIETGWIEYGFVSFLWCLFASYIYNAENSLERRPPSYSFIFLCLWAQHNNIQKKNTQNVYLQNKSLFACSHTSDTCITGGEMGYIENVMMMRLLKICFPTHRIRL